MLPLPLFLTLPPSLLLLLPFSLLRTVLLLLQLPLLLQGERTSLLLLSRVAVVP